MSPSSPPTQKGRRGSTRRPPDMPGTHLKTRGRSGGIPLPFKSVCSRTYHPRQGGYKFPMQAHRVVRGSKCVRPLLATGVFYADRRGDPPQVHSPFHHARPSECVSACRKSRSANCRRPPTLPKGFRNGLVSELSSRGTFPSHAKQSRRPKAVAANLPGATH